MWNKVLVLGALAAFVGCGPRMGEVSGVAMFEGKPIPGGLLTFRCERVGGVGEKCGLFVTVLQ